jgi:cytochrome c-type biogenesis protein CcmH/NrfF
MQPAVKSPRSLLAPALCMVALSLLLSGAAHADAPTPEEVNEIASRLWSPLGNGVRLTDCSLPVCDHMREVIAQKLAAGEDAASIRRDLAELYGEVVLGVPVESEPFRLEWPPPTWLVVGAGAVLLGLLLAVTFLPLVGLSVFWALPRRRAPRETAISRARPSTAAPPPAEAPVAGKFCTCCGQRLDPEDHFCRKCGTARRS